MPVRSLDILSYGWREPCAAQANDIEPMNYRQPAGAQHIRRDVFAHGGQAADDGQGADSDKLMDDNQPGQKRSVVHLAVAG